MNRKSSLLFDSAGLLACTAILATLTGCITEGPGPRVGYQGRTSVQGQVVVSFQDDYDYYPGYEVYYSRNRHEYVYRDGNTWVRRPELRGISVDLLVASPSVRVDFHDSPEQHHADVVKSYPRNWHRQDNQQNDKDDRKDDKKDKKDNKGNDKDDRKDDHR